MLAAAAASTLLLGACEPWHCDFWSHGACVEFTYDPGPLEPVKARVDRLLELEMPYWGVSQISGWRIQFRTTQAYTCYFAKLSEGCTDYVERTMSVRVSPGANGCFEASALLHELGHYALGDPMHSAPGWEGVDAAFGPIVWDRPDAPQVCVDRFRGIYKGPWALAPNTF
jgi:hypothetical protein